MINLHKYTQENYGLEDLWLLWLWQMCVKRDSNYKNLRIFTLWCIGKVIVSVSFRLSSACSKISKGPREIIKKPEKQPLQDRVRCINVILEDNGNNINKYNSRLACLATNITDIEKCSKFINKVREDRFFKVRERQVNKFQRLDSQNNNNSFSHHNRAIDNNQVQALDNSNNTNRVTINYNKKIIISGL